jgi:hypothetical protein
MKNKFKITEGESQRILGLHKQAILKENKIILSEYYKLNLIAASGWNSGEAPNVLNLKTFKVTQKNGDILIVKAVDSQGSQFDNIQINCKTKDILTIKKDGDGTVGAQINGSTYKPGSDLASVINTACKPADVPVKVVDEPVDEPVKVVDKPVDEPKKEVNCKNKNPFNALTDGGLNWKKERQKWVDANCKGTTPCILGNSKTNSNLRNAFCDKTWPTDQNNSNISTFDFDAVMKAIDDTGKCSNIISDVNKVYKQTKQENFLILSDNSTPEKSDLITPEGSKWKTNAYLTGDAKAYIIIGSDDDSLIQSDGLIFTCKPALIKNVSYSFYYGKTKKMYSNEELGTILKNQFCDGKINQDQNVKDEPVGDKVKSGLNNVVTPVNTTISKDKYYEYISN